MLYVDQSIGVGFSYGTDSVTGTVSATPYVWTFLQAFYAHFPQYKNRNFGLFTESYGGHYGPEFASYFESQNSAIAAGSVKGQNIKLVALGINDGWIDPGIGYKAYVDFSYNNTYKPMINASEHTSFTNKYNSKCTPALAKCAASGSTTDCVDAENVCYDIQFLLQAPKANGGVRANDFDVYDIREPSKDPYPPELTRAFFFNHPSLVPLVQRQLILNAQVLRIKVSIIQAIVSSSFNFPLPPIPSSHSQSRRFALFPATVKQCCPIGHPGRCLGR